MYIDTSNDTLITGATAPIPSADTAIATASTPVAIPGPIYVKTDSSGKAQVYFQLGTGSDPGTQRVNISVNGNEYPATFFRATATTVAPTAGITINWKGSSSSAE